jgi:hypothetical protein
MIDFVSIGIGFGLFGSGLLLLLIFTKDRPPEPKRSLKKISVVEVSLTINHCPFKYDYCDGWSIDGKCEKCLNNQAHDYFVKAKRSKAK